MNEARRTIFMNGIMKNFFLSILAAATLYSCVPTEINTTAQCGANESYDAIARKCLSTVVPLQPPKPTLTNVTLVEDGLPQSVKLTYTDVDGDQATACSVFSFSDGIDDVTDTCSCAGGVCSVILTPDPDFSGYAEFFYTLTDRNGVSAGQSVSVYVTPTNDAPSTTDVFVTADEGAVGQTYDISSYGTDPDMDTIYYVKVSDPIMGTIDSFDSVNGLFTYTSPEDDYGTYTFLYKVCDNGSPTLCSSNKTITITVNAVDDPPVANAVSVTGVEDAASIVGLSYSDVEGHIASACTVSSVTNGSITGACSCTAGGNCSVVITPDANFNSSAGSKVTFNYTVTANGLTSNLASGAITVSEVNDVPILSYIPSSLATTIPENTTVTLGTTDDLANYQFGVITDVDEGGSTLEDSQIISMNIQWTNISAPVATIVQKVDLYYNSVLKGSFTTGTDTTYIALDDTTDFDPSKLQIKVVPSANESGKVGLTISVKDDDGATTGPFSSIDIEFVATNDPPVIGDIDDIIINEADIRYSDSITITETSDSSEKSDDIWVAFDSSNTSLLPLTSNNIKVFYQYSNPDTSVTKSKVEVTWPGATGCDGRYWFAIPTDELLGLGVYDEDNSHYKVMLKFDSVDGVSGSSTVNLYAIDRNPATDPSCSNIATVTNKSFSYTVNPIGATHGGWKTISAFGQRKDRFGSAVTFNGQSSPYVYLAWNNFSTVNSGSSSSHTISGWHVFRRKTGEEYNFDAPLTLGITIDPNTFEYQDATVTANTVYYYMVRPVDSSGLELTIPTKEIFSEVRVFVPGDNLAFIHRWMMNKEVCTKMLASEDSSDPLKKIDPTNSYRCRFEGPGESYDSSDANLYYDIGHDLIVDVVEVGCPYSTNTEEPNCGSNGCIGTDHTAVTPSIVNSIFYNRSTGVCYKSDGAAWQEMDAVAAYVASYTDKSNNSFLPPLVNISQGKANEYCKARSNVTGDGFDVGQVGKFVLPTRLEQIAYSSWSSSYSYNEINDLEEGQFLNATSKCNASAASGVDAGYSDVDVPPTSYLYSLPGTKSSQIRSIYTGSKLVSGNELSELCISRYGIQDFVGNVAEWTRDRFICYAEGTANQFTCDGLTVALDPVNMLYDSDGNNPNYYDVIDSFFDSYSMDGLRGPCNDSSGGDGICDAEMTSWILYKESYFAGGFSFPTGMPINKDFASTYPYSGPSNYVLQIGSTSGIKSDDLQNDTFTLGTYNISLSPNYLAGVATGGSYKTTSEAGRYSVEFLPTVDIPSASAGRNIGSNAVISQLSDSEQQFAYINIGNEIEILSVIPLQGGQVDVTTVDPADGTGVLSASYNSAGRTLLVNFDSTLHDLDTVVATINAATGFSTEFSARVHSAATGTNNPTIGATGPTATSTALRVRPAYVNVGHGFTFQMVDTGGVALNITNTVISTTDVDVVLEIDDGVTTFTEIAAALNGSSPQYLAAEAVAGMGANTAVPLSVGLNFIPAVTFSVDYNDTTFVDMGTDVQVAIANNVAPGVPSYNPATQILTIEVNQNITTYSDLLTIIDPDSDGYINIDTNADTIADNDSLFRVFDNTANADGPLGVVGLRPIEKTLLITSQNELPSGEVTVNIVQNLSAGTSPTASYSGNTVTINIAPDNTSEDIEAELNADASAIISAKALTLTQGMGSQSKQTSSGDIVISANNTGVDANDYEILFVDSVTAGSEYVEFTSNQIKVHIEAGVTTASTAATLIDAHPVAGFLVDANVVAGHGDDVQGKFTAVKLKDGIENTENRREDIGFRCVAPINNAVYKVDSLHTYNYKDCSIAAGPDGEAKLICN